MQLDTPQTHRATRKHERPDDSDSVAQPDGQVRDAVAVQGGDPRGIGHDGVGKHTQVRRGAGRGRPDARPRRDPPDDVDHRLECGPSPVGVEQTGTQVALLHHTVRGGLDPHGTDAGTSEPRRDTRRQRAAAHHGDRGRRPLPSHAFRPLGVDEHPGVDQPPEQLLGLVAIRTALHGPSHQTDPLRRCGEFVQHAGQRWRQVVDGERRPWIQPQQPRGLPPHEQRPVRRQPKPARECGRVKGRYL